MSTADLVVALLRGLHVAGLISLFGTLLFGKLADHPTLTPGLRRLASASVAIAIAAGVLWLVVNAALIAGAGDLSGAMAAIVPVVQDTQFGSWLLIRLALLVVVACVIRAGSIAWPIAGLALMLQPELAHAGAMGGRIGLLLSVSEALHMLAAGAWFGGLMPLALALSVLPPAGARLVCRRFSGVALPAVVVLATTGTVQAGGLLGSAAGLVSTAYGRLLVFKLVLVAVAVGLGALNRFSLTDQVESSLAARRAMQRSVAAETALGLGIVLAAAGVSGLPPGGEISDGDMGWGAAVPVFGAVVGAAVLSGVSLYRRYS